MDTLPIPTGGQAGRLAVACCLAVQSSAAGTAPFCKCAGFHHHSTVVLCNTLLLPAASALLELKAALSGWDAAVAAFDIQLQGWNSSGSHSGSRSSESDPCAWTFVTCDTRGAVGALKLTMESFWMGSRCRRQGGQYSPDPADTDPALCTFTLPTPLEALTPSLQRLPALRWFGATLGLQGSLPAEWGAPGGLLRCVPPHLHLGLPSPVKLLSQSICETDSAAPPTPHPTPPPTTHPPTHSRLHTLELKNNELTGSIPEAWAGGGGNGTGAGQSQVQGWPLRDLKLQSNRLTGTLPAWLPAAFPDMRVSLSMSEWGRRQQPAAGLRVVGRMLRAPRTKAVLPAPADARTLLPPLHFIALQMVQLASNLLGGPLPGEWLAPGAWPQ